MPRFSERAVSLALVAQLVFGALAAHADEAAPVAAPVSEVEKARLLYNQALDLRDAGDKKGALQFFLVAFSHVRSPVIGLDLARAHLDLGHVVEALAVVEAIGQMPISPDEGEKSSGARTEAARLAKELAGRVAVVRVVPSRVLAPNEEVSIDGAALTVEERTSGRRVSPGLHTIVVRATPALVIEVALKEGETRAVPLDLSPGAPTAPLPPAPRTERPTSVLVYLGFGIGTAAFVVGSITGLAAISRTSSLDHACSSNGSCPPDREGDIRSAKTLGTISTFSFAMAGTGLVVGVMGLLGVGARPNATATQGGVSPYVGVGSAGLVGAF